MLTARQEEIKSKFIEIHDEWDASWESILTLDPEFLDTYLQLSSVPWSKNHLDAKTKDFICIAMNAAATHLYGPGIRQHIRAALKHGATAEEIMEVIELTSTIGIHAMSIGVPLLVKMLRESEGRKEPSELNDYQRRLKKEFTETRGYWSSLWGEILELDPEMFEAYAEFSSHPWRHGTLEPKVKELIYFAFNCAATHLYVPGLKQHMQNALGYGATPEEVMEVMEIVSLVGIQGATTATPILIQELEDQEEG